MCIFTRSSCPALVAALMLSTSPVAAEVTFTWVPVGDPGNACDSDTWGCFGGVDYEYSIAMLEVTNAQYVEFLNAKAASDPYELYNSSMATNKGGIVRSGGDGSYTYAAIAGREDMPVNYVTVFDAMRFVNWLHNGQQSGDTETGAYTMPQSSFALPPPRNPGAWIFLTSNDEWHKAAYYDPATGNFFDYPAESDSVLTCAAPTLESNTANCAGAVGDFTPVGSYPGSPSPSGTLDQGGNIREWTDTELEDIETWFIRGGSYNFSATFNRAVFTDDDYPDEDSSTLGFRVASLDGGSGGSECGDGTCEGPENALTCAQDCPEACGDAVCSSSENAANCATDCPTQCGDGFCTGFENATSCYTDCGYCGDGACNGWENPSTCQPDCGPVCGDGVVEAWEDCEAGVPLEDSCVGFGYSGGTLTCDTATCEYDRSGCQTACRASGSFCWSNSQCCSGNCTWWSCRN